MAGESLPGLCHLLHLALVEIRLLGEEGRAAQVADLADALHNIPQYLPKWNDEHAQELRANLEAYQGRYEGKVRFDYLGLLAKPGDETHAGEA